MYEFFTTYQKDILVVVITIAVFAFFCWGYFRLHPTIIYNRKPDGYVNKCPDLWILKDDGLCHPSYETKCHPFDPQMYKGKECEISKSCGTSWKGLCR